MFPGIVEGGRAIDRPQFQFRELVVDTIVAVAVSAIAFAIAGRCDWHQPRLAMTLRLVPVGAAFFWLLRRFCSIPSDYWTSPERSDIYHSDDDCSKTVRSNFFGSLFQRTGDSRRTGYQKPSMAPGPNHSYTDGATVFSPADARGGDHTPIFPAGGTVGHSPFSKVPTSKASGQKQTYTDGTVISSPVFGTTPAPQPQSGGRSFWSSFSSSRQQDPEIFPAGGSNSSRSSHSYSSPFETTSPFGTTSSFSTASGFPSVASDTTTIFPASGGSAGGGGSRHTYVS